MMKGIQGIRLKKADCLVGFPQTFLCALCGESFWFRLVQLAAIKDTNSGDFKKFDNFISCMVWEAQRDYVRLIKALNPDNA